MNIPSKLFLVVRQVRLTASIGIQSFLSKFLLGASPWSDHWRCETSMSFVVACVGFASADGTDKSWMSQSTGRNITKLTLLSIQVLYVCIIIYVLYMHRALERAKLKYSIHT